MKREIICLGFVVATYTAPVRADSYNTTFEFKSRNLSTNIVTLYAPMSNQSVVMPLGSFWQCYKKPVNDLNNGLREGGFYCFSGEAMIIISAFCSITQPQIEYGRAMVASMTKGVATIEFMVGCRTELIKY